VPCARCTPLVVRVWCRCCVWSLSAERDGGRKRGRGRGRKRCRRRRKEPEGGGCGRRESGGRSGGVLGGVVGADMSVSRTPLLPCCRHAHGERAMHACALVAVRCWGRGDAAGCLLGAVLPCCCCCLCRQRDRRRQRNSSLPAGGRAPESALLLARCVGEPRPAGRGSVSPGPWPGSLRFLLARAAGELPARWALRSVSAGPGARRVCVMPAQARPARSSSTPAWRTAGCRARIARVTPAALSSPSPSPARPGPQPHLVPA